MVLDPRRAVGSRAADPCQRPLPLPIRPPTLHEAMCIVLETKHNRWTRAKELAAEILTRSLYRRRNGFAPTSRDVSARITTCPALFGRRGYLVRLRLGPRGRERTAQARETTSSRSSFQ